MSASSHKPAAATSWSWHKQRLEQLLQQLTHLRSTLKQEALAEGERTHNHLADGSSDQFNQDLALALLAHDDDALHEVKAALDRIDHGTYGICEQSGNPIPDARLRAVPWTRYTREVEEQLENSGEMPTIKLGALDPHFRD